MARAGSSPRVRGTGGHRTVGMARCRFIPARAGNRPDPFTTEIPVPVHPRACGEQDAEKEAVPELDGSSPRVRGTDGRGLNRRCRLRFIPARAGNSRHGARNRFCRSVHPRACGEQVRCAMKKSVGCGSSPRVRGTDLNGPVHGGLIRFIPARAGNSASAAASPVTSPVHPRACGEQQVLLVSSVT